ALPSAASSAHIQRQPSDELAATALNLMPMPEFVSAQQIVEALRRKTAYSSSLKKDDMEEKVNGSVLERRRSQEIMLHPSVSQANGKVSAIVPHRPNSAHAFRRLSSSQPSDTPLIRCHPSDFMHAQLKEETDMNSGYRLLQATFFPATLRKRPL